MAKTINKTAIIGMGALGLLYGQHIADVLGKDSVSFILDDDRYKRYQSKTFTINGKALDFRMQRSSEKQTFDLVIVAVCSEPAKGVEAQLVSIVINAIPKIVK